MAYKESLAFRFVMPTKTVYGVAAVKTVRKELGALGVDKAILVTDSGIAGLPIVENVKELIEHGDEVAERYFVYHDHPGVRELAVDIFTSRYELSKVWKRKEAYVELPGENLGFEVPKTLLSYKMMVIEKALSQLRKELEDSEKKEDLDTLNQIIIRIQSLEQIKRELSIGLGGRTIIR